MGRRTDAWENDDDRVLAYQVIDEFVMPQRVKNQKTGKMETREYGLGRGVRWIIKYTLSCEVYGIGEIHPSTEYLVQKYNRDMASETVKGCATKRDIQNWISLAKKTGFITTTNQRGQRTFELNMVFLREKMLETRTRDIARMKIKEAQIAELKEVLTAIPDECEKVVENDDFIDSQRTFRGHLEDSQMQFRCNLDEKEAQNNRGNFAPNSNSNSNSNSYIKKEYKERLFRKEFEEIWKDYPRKKGKPQALKAYIKARQSGVERDTIAKGVLAYKNETANTEQRFIKHGSTWFNQGLWEDDYVEETPADTNFDTDLPAGF